MASVSLDCSLWEPPKEEYKDQYVYKISTLSDVGVGGVDSGVGGACGLDTPCLPCDITLAGF